MVELDGSGHSVELAPGYHIATPGLRGTARAVAARRGRGPELATSGFDEALAAANMTEVRLIELDVQPVEPPAQAKRVRTASGEDGLVLEVPDLGPTMGQIVLAVDEDGAVSWNFPQDAAGHLETPDRRGAGGVKRFVIRRTVASTPPPQELRKRSLTGVIGRKLLKVIVYPVTDAVFGSVADFFVGRWEAIRRPYRLRPFSPDNYGQKVAEPMSDDWWRRLATGRSLLFVHGTFSTAHGAFAGLSPDTIKALYHGYGQRIFAFDHPTLSHDPIRNVEWFRRQMPRGVSLEADIVCHSRGGLVARILAGELPDMLVPGLQVRRIAFVGVPNHGTVLAAPNHVTDMLDRFTSLLNLAPPGPLWTVSETLEAVAIVVKVIGHAALKGLDGLTCMDPGGQFLAGLNRGAGVSAQCYAVTSDYEPGGGLRNMVTKKVADVVMDRVFEEEPNDLVVPTLGVYQGRCDSTFPIPAQRVHTFGHKTGVRHTEYFQQKQTTEKLLEWFLSGSA